MGKYSCSLFRCFRAPVPFSPRRSFFRNCCTAACIEHTLRCRLSQVKTSLRLHLVLVSLDTLVLLYGRKGARVLKIREIIRKETIDARPSPQTHPQQYALYVAQAMQNSTLFETRISYWYWQPRFCTRSSLITKVFFNVLSVPCFRRCSEFTSSMCDFILLSVRCRVRLVNQVL